MNKSKSEQIRDDRDLRFYLLTQILRDTAEQVSFQETSKHLLEPYIGPESNKQYVLAARNKDTAPLTITLTADGKVTIAYETPDVCIRVKQVD
jgi:hypothetical protein